MQFHIKWSVDKLSTPSLENEGLTLREALEQGREGEVERVKSQN